MSGVLHTSDIVHTFHMRGYIEIEFPSIATDQKEILIAELDEIGFEGFEESETSLKAFIPASAFDEAAFIEIATQQKAIYNKSILEETNWNTVWESNFNPIIIDNFVAVRAEFHEPVKNAEHELIITPRMSFGTGHHATTCMMIEQMRQIDFAGKIVFDFGTGTGILAILAEKLGANTIIAVDNDEWSIENATENIQRNNCSLIRLYKNDRPVTDQSFDIILANINKNVILDCLPLLAGQLRNGGVLLLCGLLPEDENDVFRKTSEYSLQIIRKATRDNWLCLRVER
ncbi:MAG: 50S ribosomal protein L11 methyltransferase [Bacteroidota bacterium]|nr:50S ribosomal protein L11 methyltransferase [Bacteroidota bacterium]